jgi:deoxyinosine 3'endonuclease (endonuclease V)
MDTGGVPFQTIRELKGVQHLAHLDDSHALVLMDGNGSLDLRAIELP